MNKLIENEHENGNQYIAFEAERPALYKFALDVLGTGDLQPKLPRSTRWKGAKHIIDKITEDMRSFK